MPKKWECLGCSQECTTDGDRIIPTGCMYEDSKYQRTAMIWFTGLTDEQKAAKIEEIKKEIIPNDWE